MVKNNLPFPNAVSVFHGFSMRYCGFCQFFAWYCGFEYPPPPNAPLYLVNAFFRAAVNVIKNGYGPSKRKKCVIKYNSVFYQLACIYLVKDAPRKFGEHEENVTCSFAQGD